MRSRCGPQSVRGSARAAMGSLRDLGRRRARESTTSDTSFSAGWRAAAVVDARGSLRERSRSTMSASGCGVRSLSTGGEDEEIIKRIAREGAVRLEWATCARAPPSKRAERIRCRFRREVLVLDGRLEKSAVSYTKGCYHGRKSSACRGSLSREQEVVQVAITPGSTVSREPRLQSTG